MPNENGLAQAVLFDEPCYVFREVAVGVFWGMWRVAMISEVLLIMCQF